MNPIEDSPTFEQGPIRPPSEARSLLIRVTRNCPWNRCAFCHTYQGTTFSLRTVAEIKQDILQMARVYGGDSAFTSAFLQDANSLLLKTDDLAEVISFIRKTFPTIRRITTYARAKTAARKKPDDLKRLQEAGLSRIHVGMESGYDPLLKFISKGVAAEEQVEGGQKIRAAGISLCEYVMPGLGGSRWSTEHAVETATALNRINPDYIRLRTLQVVPGTPLAQMVREGAFQPLDDEAILREIRLFLETLEGITSEVVSDHILNLLEELEGKLPADRERMIGTIDRFFALPREQQMIFRVGRRMGIYRRIDNLSEGQTNRRIEELLKGYRGKDPLQLERDLAEIRSRYI